MSSELLTRYDWDTNTYKPFAGTEDWELVAELGDEMGGYDWTEFKVFYSPSARRYFWHGDSGCSCNSWNSDLDNVDSFENGDRASLLRAWETFTKDHEYSIPTSAYMSGVSEIRAYKAAK